MELLNELNIIWSDKNQTTQSFESYILRSIYNVPQLMSSIRNLTISKFELSLNGLITLMTNLPLLIDFIITDGRIDQMGSGMSDIERMIGTTADIPQSDIKTMVMNNIQMSRRTAVNFCLITEQLISLTLNDVKILDKIIISKENKTPNPPNFLVLLKQIAQSTDQFQWTHLKTLTLGLNIFMNFRNTKSHFLFSRKKFNYSS
jgi:hypothetical protein